MPTAPSFWSLALAEITDPDYTHVSVDVLPAHATADPQAWARALLSPAALPRWLAASLAVGGLFTRRSAPFGRAAIRRVEGDEALIGIDRRCFDARIAIGVDECTALVRVVAALRLKGPLTVALSLPVRAVLPFVVRGMVGRVRRELSRVTR